MANPIATFDTSKGSFKAEIFADTIFWKAFFNLVRAQPIESIVKFVHGLDTLVLSPFSCHGK